MRTFDGTLHMAGVTPRPMDIQIDLDTESMSMHSQGRPIGTWPLPAVVVSGRDDGFEVRICGVPATLRTSNDGAFANQLGLRTAPPRLRRLMAVDRRIQSTTPTAVEVDKPRSWVVGQLMRWWLTPHSLPPANPNNSEQAIKNIRHRWIHRSVTAP